MGNHSNRNAHRSGARAARAPARATPAQVTPEDVAHAKAQRAVKTAERAVTAARTALTKADEAQRAASAAKNAAYDRARTDLLHQGVEAAASRAPVSYARYQAAREELKTAEPAYRAAQDRVRALDTQVMGMYQRATAHLDGNNYATTHSALVQMQRSAEFKAVNQALRAARKEADHLAKPYYRADSVVRAMQERYANVTREQIDTHPLMRAAQAAIDRAAARWEAAGRALSARQSAVETAHDAVRRAAGEADRSHGGLGLFVEYGAHAQQTVRSVFGRDISTQLLTRITGAHIGDTIHVERTGTHSVSINRNGGGVGGSAGYTIARLSGDDARTYGVRSGSLVMSVGLVRSSGKTTSSGRELINAFSTLRSLGIQRIMASAARGGGMNGYYTWAQIGGQGKIPENVLSAARERFGGSISRVEQLVDKPGGLAWWHQHGDTFGVTLDLSAGGRTSQFLDRYEQMLANHEKRQGGAA